MLIYRIIIMFNRDLFLVLVLNIMLILLVLIGNIILVVVRSNN